MGGLNVLFLILLFAGTGTYLLYLHNHKEQ